MNNLLLSLQGSKVVLELMNGQSELGIIKNVMPDQDISIVDLEVKKGIETTSKYIPSDKIVTVKDLDPEGA